MIATTVENTLGAEQIGVTVATFLFGIVTLQFQYYLHTFEEDKRTFRILACLVWLLELLHTGCVCAEVYRGTIVYYGDMAGYSRYPYMGVATILSGIITMLVHLFFALRVWKSLPSPFCYIGAFCATATIVRGAGGAFLGTQVIKAKTLAEYRTANGWLIATLLATGAAIDLIIAVSMLYWLISNRQKDMGTTTTLIDRLVAYTIRTGVLTSITATAVLLTFRLFPETFIWVGFYVVLAKLYSNSLFSALNERERMRGIIAASSEDSGLRKRQRQISKDFQTSPALRHDISMEMKSTMIHDDEENVLPYKSMSHENRIIPGQAL